MSDLPTEPVAMQEPIVARAGAYYRNMRYLMCVVLIGMGGWFGYDGYVKYPQQNEQIRALSDQRDQAQRAGNRTQAEALLAELNRIHEGRQHTPADLLIQRGLGFGLPPLGILVLLWALYNSRGEYRLENDVLSIPGHPPIPLTQIMTVDRRLWDRKGIAYVKYQLADGGSGKARLDDFVYERFDTDAIYDRLPSGSDKAAKASAETSQSIQSDTES